jgi:DNA-directed RNA polymerase specialized sigma24 family protein
VVLTKVQGLTCGEAADVLEVPSGTLKWWVSQGLKMLREQMKEDPG